MTEGKLDRANDIKQRLHVLNTAMMYFDDAESQFSFMASNHTGHSIHVRLHDEVKDMIYDSFKKEILDLEREFEKL